MNDTIPPILTKPFPETMQLLLQAVATQCEHTAKVMQDRDEARKDTARLDWLDCELGPGYIGALVRIANLMHNQPNFRAAIDEAMTP